jgi:thymidine kinase
MSAKLKIIIGPMYSSKSSEIIRQSRLMSVINKKYIVVKPKIDNRYDADKVSTHNLETQTCFVVNRLEEINDKLDDVEYILIDEAQFFENLKENVIYYLEEKNINVVLTGLDGDSNRNKFGEILDLIPYADSVKKKLALCKICNDGTEAPFTKRISQEKSQILIGSDNKFMPVCRHHYLNSD